MTEQELKQFIIEHKYFPGWEIVMFIKQLYPQLFKKHIIRGGDGILLPGGCILTRLKSGKWFIISHSEQDVDHICRELSKFNSIGTGCGIVPQDLTGTSQVIRIGKKTFFRKNFEYEEKEQPQIPLL